MQVNSPQKFWNWTHQIFLPTLYLEDWYNGDKNPPDEARLSSNLVAYRLGPPRLRQVRVKPGMRKVEIVFKHLAIYIENK